MPYRKKRLLKRKKFALSQTKKYNNAVNKRLYTPFSKFTSMNKKKYNVNIHQTNNFDNGLSRKEKSYVISNCQNKSTRYIKLKGLAETATRENKIFSIYGTCNPVRKALLDRGWIEKFPPNRMNLLKIRSGKYSSKIKIQSELERLLLSNFVQKCNPNFIWRTKDQQRDTTIDMIKDCNMIVNKLVVDAIWTSKQGLCSIMKRNYWFYIQDIAEVNGPRSYNTSDFGEIEAFEKDYQITACTSLLKWILSMVANNRPIFIDTGKISLTVVIFALNRCKEYLYRKENKDIDRCLSSVSRDQWDLFFKKYHSIIGKAEVFQSDKENKLPLYLSYAKFLLREIHKYRPQLSCEGCHNIWMLKPAYCSRGRGIRMASELGVIMNLLEKANSKYVIQKYIEEPLLIYDTKFDIRQYYLVTSTYPLIIWMYKDCYLKFSSQKYSLRKYHESIHLTNYAIQKKYKNCTGRHSELPTQNMWDLETYKVYLNKIGKGNVWENIIYPGMRKSIIGIMLNCQDSITVCKNRFELYGCDFILDKECSPWLIEINSCPDLNHTTQVTAKICPAVISDLIKVVIDYANNPKASTGNFECIYKQPISLPRYGSSAELAIRGFSLPADYFYRQNAEVQETYDGLDMNNKNDVKTALFKLKQFYDANIVTQTKEKYDSQYMVKELVEDDHLDDLKDDNITIEKEISSKICIINKNSYSWVPSNTSSNPIQHVRSVTDMRSLLKKSLSGFKSFGFINKHFMFSKLDDGPQGKGSFLKL